MANIISQTVVSLQHFHVLYSTVILRWREKKKKKENVGDVASEKAWIYDNPKERDFTS